MNRTRVGTLACLFVWVAGCSSNLEPAEARRLAEEQLGEGTITCTWLGANSDGARRYYVAGGGTTDTNACAAQLVDAGLIRRDECRTAPPWCFERYLTPLAPAAAVPHGIAFPCGRETVADVSSITTTDGTASFMVTRTVTLDQERLRALPGCEWFRPRAEGSSEVELHAVRDDAGHWRLSE
jgi:hypothetical protein